MQVLSESISVDLKPTQWEGWVFKGLRGLLGREGGYTLHSWAFGVRMSPIFSSRVPWAVGLLPLHNVSLSTDSISPMRKGLVGEEREKEWKWGSRVSQLPITNSKLFCVCNVWLGNLGSHGTVRSNGNFQLVVLGISLPGRLRALWGRTHTDEGHETRGCPGVLPWPAASHLHSPQDGACLPKARWRTLDFVWIMETAVPSTYLPGERLRKMSWRT